MVLGHESVTLPTPLSLDKALRKGFVTSLAAQVGFLRRVVIPAIYPLQKKGF